MDGISSASAVVSLTVQLISTTRDIINFLQEIQDSPEELRCTIESLDQLRGIFEVVKSGLETRIDYVDLPPPLVLVSNALKICESKITVVELCVNKFKLVLDGQSRVRKKWASFKHVLKKGEIRKLQDQLDKSTMNLQGALIINANELAAQGLQVGAATREMVSTLSNNQQLFAQEVSLASSRLKNLANAANSTHVKSAPGSDSALRTRDVQRAITNLSGSLENDKQHSSLRKSSNLRSKDKELKMSSPNSLPKSRVISKESLLFWRLSFVGNISFKTKTKVITNTVNVPIVNTPFMAEEHSIVIRPSFRKNQYELRVVNTCGRISTTLSSDCVIDFKAPIFSMCRSGDIRGLRDAFCSGSASLNVVDPLGMGLMHYAAGGFQKELCSWLLDIGVGADRTSMMGNTALTYMGTESRIDQSSAVTKTMIEIARLLAQAQEDISAFDISMWFREYEGPPEGAELILSQDLAQYYISSRDDSDSLYPALASILRLYAKKPEPWEPVIRILIRYGANLHAPVRRVLKNIDQSEYICPIGRYSTPLDELFTYTIDPFEGQVAANGWLRILASEGQNISAYLEEESTSHAKSMQLTRPFYRTLGYKNERKLVFEWGASPTVSWDWWISPTSSISLLQEEFRLMAINLPDELLKGGSWKEAWPFRYPEWSGVHQHYDDGNALSKKLQDHADARAARRVMKKARKTALAQKYKGPRKVPGAWPI